jgi:D-lactate dehydrogenase
VDAYTKLWNIRKGLFPAVGAVRRIGTTVVIEDVAFPIDRLADATLDLRDLLNRHGYAGAIIFGHALEGNLHFVFTQDFALPPEVRRYRDFMADLCDLVVNRYDGSLKAEHGTGRNMAPFVEMEWGREAYDLMGRIKRTFDPHHLLNPGVILNPDPEAHLKDLKPLPPTHPVVDKCIECGFCEIKCPSRNLTLTPRQRIVACREIARLEATGGEPARCRDLRSGYGYQGEATCAADGMCATGCPVSIDTGALTKFHRSLENSPTQKKWADRAAHRFAETVRTVRATLKSADAFHGVMGSAVTARAAKAAREISGGRLPLWNPFMPRGVDGPHPKGNGGGDLRVVYFPSCVARAMGPARSDPDGEPLPKVTERVLERAGYHVIYPEKMENLCCGTPFETKGFTEQADRKSRELERALLMASEDGAYPILCETSPCLFRMRKTMSRRLRLYEPGEFSADFLLDRLGFRKLPETVALHMTCSSAKMGVEEKLRRVAEACAETVVIPEAVGCCGFAGDRGFSHPELNAAALADLKSAVSGRCTAGYSNSRTCEIGLSLHSGIHYKSILYLVDRCTRPVP